MSLSKLDKVKVGAVILAAGNSSRLGQSKQSIVINNQTLLQHTIACFSDSNVFDTLVVLGYNAPKLKQSHGLNIPTTINDNWEKGMGSSIKHGVSELLKLHPKLAGILIAVCDQPFLNARHINEMIDHFNDNSDAIIASKYKAEQGVPVIFPNRFFNQLITIDNSKGAKTLLSKNKKTVLHVHFPKGEIDIDTPQDLIILRDLGH